MGSTYTSLVTGTLIGVVGIMRDLLVIVVIVSMLYSTQVQCQEKEKDVAKADSEDELQKKREQLRWFPADNEEDCEQEPGVEQVREGKPSKACREDEERFCLCGRVGGKEGKVDWRFLCGTCNISFKLDRTKKIGQDIKKTEAKNVKNVSKRRKL